MTDELEIRSGGAIAVDTASLDAAAAGFDRAATALDDLAADLRAVAFRIDPVASSAMEEDVLRARAQDASALADEGRRIAADLRAAGDVYELVELRALLAAAQSSGDRDAIAAATLRLDMERTADPAVADRADAVWAAWRMDAGWDVGVQATLVAGMLGVAGQAAAALALLGVRTLLHAGGWATIGPDDRLTGAVPSVRTRVVDRPRDVAAPSTLAAAAARIPTGQAERVRVERYTMADGSRQYAVYIAGTRSTARGGGEPFDNQSNLRLYTGGTAASYEATRQALHGAGAQPGDVVHVVGHSQGAMVGTRLAVEGEFDTRTLVTIGSPVTGDVGADTLVVSLRHSDDPVVALSDGGSAGIQGAPGSFVAERTADPLPHLGDIRMPAHALDAYIGTAAMVDASHDPRIDAVRGVLGGLGDAVAVDTTLWSARRIDDGEVSSGAAGAG